jgi:type II secretory pathway predicted ATPase ExeA
MKNFSEEQYWRALDYFDIVRDPFDSGIDPDRLYETGDLIRVKMALTRAAADKIIVGIIGKAGTGKSSTLSYSLRTLEGNPRTIHVQMVEAPTLEVEKLNIQNIQESVLRKTGGWTKGLGKSSRPTRENKLKKALYDAGHTVLVIDEAQLIHPNTLRAIKRLWSLKYAGKSPLLSIVLIGQTPIENLIDSVEEVSKRVVKIKLQGMSAEEIAGYLEFKLPNYFPESVAASISRYADYPLDVNNIARKALVSAYLSQRDQISEDDINNAVGLNWLRMRREKLGYSKKEFQAQVAKLAKIDKKIVDDAEAGIMPTDKKTFAAMEKAVAELGGVS